MTHLLIVSKINKTKYIYDFFSDELSQIELIIEQFLNTVPSNISHLCRIQVVESKFSSFSSLKEEDSYFSDAILVSSLEELYEKTQKKKELDIVDVARYVLNKFPDITAFSLQKSLYYIYAEYLCKYKYPLFQANFVAFDNGPVDQDLYKIFKYHKETLMYQNSLITKLYNNDKKNDIINYIDTIIEKSVPFFNQPQPKWTDKSINFTHRNNTPWTIAYTKLGQNASISDDLIKNHHSYEK